MDNNQNDDLHEVTSALNASGELNQELKVRMELALLGSNDGLWDWNILDNSVYFSPRWKEMLGFSDDELSNELPNWAERLHPDDVDETWADVHKNVNGETEYYENVHRLRHKHGHWVWILDRGKTQYDENGKAVRMLGTHTDITEEKKMQLRYAHQAQIIEQVHDSVISTDLDGMIVSWNKGSKTLLGYTSKEMQGQHIRTIYLEDDYEELDQNIAFLKQNGKCRTVVRLVQKSKEIIYAELSLSLLKDEKEKPIGMVGYAHDITERKKVEDELLEQQIVLQHQAHHDALTELPNRTLFNDRLQQAVEKAKRNNSLFALFFIDLDRFKQINDSLGHSIGDNLLKVVTERLKATIRREDTLARLGGDEFTIIMEDLSKAQDASILAQKILEVLQDPIEIDAHSLYVSSSIGISLYPQDDTDAGNLLKYADAAMYRAKEEGRNNFQFYSAEMTELALERLYMTTSMRQALKNEEFVIHYQPQIDAESNTLIGMEALVRWQHPTKGLLSPITFLPLAEETGMIIELDHWVMRTGIKQVAQWYKEGLKPGVLSLNLSMKQLEHHDFIRLLQENIETYGFKTEWLELEVTEGQVMQKPEAAIAKLGQINALGIGISIDDFGTGYSSLSSLKRLPINTLKIDRSFVMDLPQDEEDAAIVRAIIALARSLNLDLIAEGVETSVQKEFLLANDCKNIQGYYYSRPIPAEEIHTMLTKETY
ncbi:MAG: EAL domain-containing protein [Sulfurimonadaceae bacterium]